MKKRLTLSDIHFCLLECDTATSAVGCFGSLIFEKLGKGDTEEGQWWWDGPWWPTIPIRKQIESLKLKGIL